MSRNNRDFFLRVTCDVCTRSYHKVWRQSSISRMRSSWQPWMRLHPNLEFKGFVSPSFHIIRFNLIFANSIYFKQYLRFILISLISAFCLMLYFLLIFSRELLYQVSYLYGFNLICFLNIFFDIFRLNLFIYKNVIV